MGLVSEVYTVTDAEALLMDAFDLKAQDKHLSPMHLIKLSSILKKQIKIKQGYSKPQMINRVLLFMLSSWKMLENKQHTDKHLLNSYPQARGTKIARFAHLDNFMDPAGSTYLKRIILMFVFSCLACNPSLRGLEHRKEQQPATSEIYTVVWEL